MTVKDYVNQFQSIKLDRSSGRPRPHKVCMLFAVMDFIEQGVITVNRIYYNDQLKSRFTHYFNVLKSGNDQNSPFLPFNHLKTSKFWHLKVKPELALEFDAKSISDNSIRTYVEYVFLNEDLFLHLQNKYARIALRDALTFNLNCYESQYYRWAKSLGKSERTVKSYIGVLKNTIPNLLQEHGVDESNLLKIGSKVEYQTVTSKAFEIKEFVEKNRRGNNMYSAAINSYQSFLDDFTQAEVENDIEIILADESKSPTDKLLMMKTRVGQGRYRKDLIKLWQGCSLTGYSNFKFLVASHIKPWSKSDDNERLDPYNGLLLLANIDKAFDLGYITFDEKGKIIISEQLDDYQMLGINKEMGIELTNKHQEYLCFHREITFN